MTKHHRFAFSFPRERSVAPRGRALAPWLLCAYPVWILGLGDLRAAPPARAPIAVVASAENDLWRVLSANQVPASRFDSLTQAIEQSSIGGGVMVLADQYPTSLTTITPEQYSAANAKQLRLYVEYPASVPDLEVGQPRGHKTGPYGSNLDREVVTSAAFGWELKPMRILLVHGCQFVPVKIDRAQAHLVTARVAGFNYATFGLPAEDVWPILFEHPREHLLVSTTKLSHFVTGRYAPTDAWPAVWRMILRWLQPEEPAVSLQWTPTVRPTYQRAETLADDAEFTAFRRGTEWMVQSRLFVDPSGKQGFHEGYNSKKFYLDGSHEISRQVRTDCAGEVAFCLALGAEMIPRPEYREIAANLNDLIYFESIAGRGPRQDPQSPTYGLIGGDLMVDSGVYYGDDSCRHLLGTMGSSVILHSTRWNDRAALEMLANLRTTGRTGFRANRLEEAQIQQAGWQSYWHGSANAVGQMPHYQAYPWAMYLWLYHKTGFTPLLERTRTACRLMMEAFPEGWGSEANRYETERCRMLLPLAWLVRVDDTPEHRRWLREVARYVIGAQHASGAIRQRVVHETTRNEDYGAGECALIQANGDPATDLLYASNYALIGLHEAARATNDPEIRQAEDRLADFIVRIQVRSETHPELDGAWYRGFDFERWDYWGSDGDVGWGVWCTEMGWIQSWITTTLALRHKDTSLWELLEPSSIADPFHQHRPVLIPDAVLDATPAR